MSVFLKSLQTCSYLDHKFMYLGVITVQFLTHVQTLDKALETLTLRQLRKFEVGG